MHTLLKRVNPEQHMNRWYLVTIQPTLLEPLAVICAWGSRETNAQRVQVFPQESPEDAEAMAEKIVQAKLRRGYELVQVYYNRWGGYLPRRL